MTNLPTYTLLVAMRGGGSLQLRLRLLHQADHDAVHAKMRGSGMQEFHDHSGCRVGVRVEEVAFYLLRELEPEETGARPN